MPRHDGSEHVLCVQSILIDPALDGQRGYIPDREPAATLRMLLKGAKFLPRTDELEADERYRQVILYGVLYHKGSIFAYERTKHGGEGRLYALRSVGVGGHVNPCDGEPTDLDTPLRCLHREIQQEVYPLGYSWPKPIGWLVLDQTPVDRVHLGLVYQVEMLSEVIQSEPSISPLGWLNLGQLLTAVREAPQSWEAWSVAVVEGLAKAERGKWERFGAEMQPREESGS